MSIQKMLCSAWLATSMLLCGGVLQADPTADARKAIQARYDHSNVGVASKEIKPAMSIYTFDFVQVDNKGEKHDLAEVRQHAEQTFELATSITGTSAIQTITLKGTSAAVRVKEHGTVVIPDAKTRIPNTLAFESISDDVWVKTRTGWMLQRSRTVSEKFTFNGKPVSNPPPAKPKT